MEFRGAVYPATHPHYRRVCKLTDCILHSNRNIPEMHGKDWTVWVVNCEEKNAFVEPVTIFYHPIIERFIELDLICSLSQGGNIFVYSGMLEVCGNDDQLGIVLCHEIAHNILNHVASFVVVYYGYIFELLLRTITVYVLFHQAEKLSYVSFVNMLVLVPLAVLWAVVPSDGLAIVADWFFKRVIDVVFELPFSRNMEREADEVQYNLRIPTNSRIERLSCHVHFYVQCVSMKLPWRS